MDLTSRIDERTKNLIEKQELYCKRLDECIEKYNHMINKISQLEIEYRIMKEIKDDLNQITNDLIDVKTNSTLLQQHNIQLATKWKTILDYIYKGMWVLIMSYILYRLGLGNIL